MTNRRKQNYQIKSCLLPPKIFIQFHHPLSRQNECKNILESAENLQYQIFASNSIVHIQNIR